MRGYFEDEEPAREERGRDKELTLGAGALLAIFIGLVLLCGLFFGLGYAVGHRNSEPSAPAGKQMANHTAAPDQEPLEGNGLIPKPSAAAQAPVPPPQPGDASAQAGGAGSGSSQQGAAGQSGQPGPGATSQTPAQVRSALPPPSNAPQPVPAAPAQNVRPALPSSAGQLMVQVAAVSHNEDADVLANALRRRGYPVTSRREPVDGLIHVRVGPFASREEANRWRDKLLGDGYNAIVQP